MYELSLQTLMQYIKPAEMLERVRIYLTTEVAS